MSRLIRWLPVGLPALALGCLTVAACLWAVGTRFYSTDAVVMYHAGRALALENQLVIPPESLPQIVITDDGRAYSKYDPGMALLSVPIIRYADDVAKAARANRYGVAGRFVMIIPALSMGIAIVALYAVLRSYDASTRVAILIGLVTLFGTMIWPYGRLYFAEATITACVTIAMAAMLVPKQLCVPTMLVVGLALGMALMMRAHTAIYVLPVALFILTDSSRQLAWRRLTAMMPGVALGVVVVFFHNWLRFGNIFTVGYVDERFVWNPLPGMVGMLLSPGKSIFLYAPPLMISAVLFPRFRRVYPRAAKLVALTTLCVVPFYAAWWSWHGGWVWGPRFLVPLIPVWMLPWVMLPHTRQWVATAGLIFLLGVGVQVIASFTDVNAAYIDAFAGAQNTDDVSRYAMVHYSLDATPLANGIYTARCGKWEAQAIYHLQSTDLTADWVYGVPQAIDRVLFLSALILVWGLWRNPQ